MRSFLFFSLLLISSSSEGAQPDWANRAYSNVRLHKTEGDLTGWRMQIIQSAKGDFALIQPFEGVASPPCLVKIEWKGKEFFADSTSACDFQSKIKGEFKRNKLIIEFSGGILGEFQNKGTLSPVY